MVTAEQNTDKTKFCQKCGTSLLKISAPVSDTPVQLSSPKPESLEIAKQARILRERIAEKQVELDDANSFAGPLILAIIGVLTAIWLIGIVLILAAIVWYELRYAARPKIRTEITTLEALLRELE